MVLEQRVKTSRYDPQVELPALPDYAAMTDEQVFDRIRRQDLAACGVYYARHAATIYGRLAAILGDREAAGPLLEVLFLQMWQRRRELATLGLGVTDALVDQSTAVAVDALCDRATSMPTDEASGGSPADRARIALLERCGELGRPDASDAVVRECIETMLADAQPVTPPPDIRQRLSLRLGHPDVDRAARRYARRWWWQMGLACLIGLAVVAGGIWLIVG